MSHDDAGLLVMIMAVGFMVSVTPRAVAATVTGLFFVFAFVRWYYTL